MTVVINDFEIGFDTLQIESLNSSKILYLVFELKDDKTSKLNLDDIYNLKNSIDF